MKRTLFLLTAFLAVLSCTRTQDLGVPETAQEAVGFDVYTHGAVETRAGYPGEINLDVLKVTGFGVYGYVSDKPDFMANQHVTYSGGWVYSPVKYWPNQDGVDIDFYAYAPYVEQSDFDTLDEAQTDAASATPAKEGIVYVHPNSVATSPKIVYRTPKDPANSVDLMFGVAAEAHSNPDVTVGLPFLNMTKLKLGEKMKFNFKHALTKLVVNVDGNFDEVNSGNNDVDANTRVVIKSVNIKTTQLAVGGTLDLKNSVADTPSWTVGTTLSAYNANAGYDLPVASNLKYVTGNEADVTHFSQQPLGVTKTTQSLMGYGIDGTTAACLLFVPNGAAADLTISITYEVITRDPNLGKGYNRMENVISQTIAAANLGANAFQAGYGTTLNLHLGLASVKFDAEVTNWETGETESVDLPENKEIVWGFSVSSGVKVQFASSNLMYQGDGQGGGTWSLMENPWSVVENASLENDNYGYDSSGLGTKPIGLFGWGTSGLGDWAYTQPWNTITSTSGYAPDGGNAYQLPQSQDWGNNSISRLSGSGWRTPTKTEWEYLIGSSCERALQYGKGKIGAVCGFFLLPDAGTGKECWNDPRPNGKSFTRGYLSWVGPDNEYTVEEWELLAAAGAVFLPAAGERQSKVVQYVNRDGSYLSSYTSNGFAIYILHFSNEYSYGTNALSVKDSPCYFGASVRLIRNVTE